MICRHKGCNNFALPAWDGYCFVHASKAVRKSYGVE